ncbi:MAG: hypothetical protein A3F70_09165 [Acidobacteria bacterium RIFCSPLOWO2_12_FULL_67_14]|nr:MAG: hypothetical protein A3H29_02965 [Acidobacteria bacterium RIFCSPLOWO2_02_FULL_67_21]OFW40665.1 MAG: hypothetical protein A3F70_09165 [Acidobacteria bacterium RIFCSPLOWO2_12_FULL_67_14]
MLCLLALFPTIALGQEYIRVPERQTHTDVKAGPSSGSIVLVLIPSGTVLPVVKRQGEWIQVRLSPELRLGIPMRWYKNEELGFVHDSTVDVVKGRPPAQASQEPPVGQPPRQYVRVPPRQTNTDVKAGAGSGSIVLLLVPSGTVLPVVGRQGEWIRVDLPPELRRIGTPMRWYKNEESGFVHESTVEVFER